ncbi:MAG TPA: GNAT family N-acetyltransferase [Actinomycetota bacterium]|jgi:GNAT superfamily N-acetyltransferase|nr:GNAT family N-acetyltransferase [Actinomycetota bacterium]
MSSVAVRPGHAHEASLLSDLALRSKGHWGYDQAFLDACRDELTLTPAEVRAKRTIVAERDGRVVGFYTLAGDPPVASLDHLFVEPGEIGTGVGRTLWRHAVAAAQSLGFTRMEIEADPDAEAFYLAMGARRRGTASSGSIPGRELPLLEYDFALPEASAPVPGPAGR